MLFLGAKEQTPFQIQIQNLNRKEKISSNFEYEIQYQMPKVKSVKYPETAEKIQQYFETENENILKEFRKNMDEYNKVVQDFKGEYSWYVTSNLEWKCKMETSDIISFRLTGEFWRGDGTIETNMIGYGAVFDVHTGKKLELTDIIIDVDEFHQEADSYVAQSLYEQLKNEQWGEKLYNFSDEMDDGKWYLTKKGIVMMLWPEEKDASEIYGIDILIPYSEIIDNLKSDYLWQKDGKKRKNEENTFGCQKGMYIQECEKILKENGFMEQEEASDFSEKVFFRQKDSKIIKLYTLGCSRFEKYKGDSLGAGTGDYVVDIIRKESE